MTLLELIEDALKRNGYDGLYNPGVCACKLDDLCPCGEPGLICEAGVMGSGNHCDRCADGMGECDFHIGPKPKDESCGVLVKGNACTIGDVTLLRNPSESREDWEPYGVKFALVIEFNSVDEIRKAIKEKQCSFTVFGD